MIQAEKLWSNRVWLSLDLSLLLLVFLRQVALTLNVKHYMNLLILVITTSMQATNFIFILLMVSGTGKVKRKVPTTVVPGDQIVPITVSCCSKITYCFSPQHCFFSVKKFAPIFLLIYIDSVESKLLNIADSTK